MTDFLGMIEYGDVSVLYVRKLIEERVDIKKLRDAMRSGLKKKLKTYEYAVESGAENNIIDWKKEYGEIKDCLKSLKENEIFKYKGIIIPFKPEHQKSGLVV